MKKEYNVEFIKRVLYNIEAENEIEAKEIAIEWDSDKGADMIWLNAPYDKVIVKEV